MSETNGLDEANNVTPSEASKNKILNLIKGITLNDINGEEIEENKENYITESDDEDGESEGITEFLRTIEEESLNNSKVIGTSLSGYWAPNLAKDILRVCKDFPLWTNVMKISFNSTYDTSTSASVESDFGDLKRKTLRYEVQPMTADRFVIKHLKAIDSNTKLFRNKKSPEKNIKRSLFENLDEGSDSEVSEISEGRNEMDAFDNWRGLGDNNEIEVNINQKPIKRKKTKNDHIYGCSARN
ncbi:Hypothetical protein CINCED_3A004183 [Cinara cedri]|uniref:Uncharacterized protein n=1 Tax=Cinara cedri TaxID=506608 RepID=A0A5E4M0H7_9HEMI|nr:Hypothetical protein CINCED_3A004183 [Cinara cedri]